MLGNSVKISVQNDLADEGKHNLVDGICLGLDGEYPDWKSPTQTYMVPNSFPFRQGDKGSNAEYIIYSRLQECGTNHKEPMFVVHSCPFSEHIPESDRKRSWVMGETDFVIIHKVHGPIYIEVKATDTGRSYKEAEQQLQKGKLALQRRFENAVEGEITTKKVIEIFKNFPAFVAMQSRKGKSKDTFDSLDTIDSRKSVPFAALPDTTRASTSSASGDKGDLHSIFSDEVSTNVSSKNSRVLFTEELPTEDMDEDEVFTENSAERFHEKTNRDSDRLHQRNISSNSQE